MAQYRIYRRRATGGVEGAPYLITCEDDAAALAVAGRHNDGNGVVNLACILGLGKAIEYLESVGIDKVEEHNLSLRNRLHEKLKNFSGLTIAGPPPGPLASPMIALVLPDKFRKAAFVQMLLTKYKLSIRPTHNEFGFNGIRFSMHIFNTAKEVDLAAEILQKELTT